jgi:hypothetical protein
MNEVGQQQTIIEETGIGDINGCFQCLSFLLDYFYDQPAVYFIWNYLDHSASFNFSPVS